MTSAIIEWWVLWLCGLIGAGLIAIAKSYRNNTKKMTEDIRNKIDMLAKSDAQKHDELEQKLDLITRGQLETMRYRLRKNTERLLEEGCATLDELEDLEHLFDSYADLGGNSTLEAKYKACLFLPTRCEKGK